MTGSDHIRSTDKEEARIDPREQSGFEEAWPNKLRRDDGS